MASEPGQASWRCRLEGSLAPERPPPAHSTLSESGHANPHIPATLDAEEKGSLRASQVHGWRRKEGGFRQPIPICAQHWEELSFAFVFH